MYIVNIQYIKYIAFANERNQYILCTYCFYIMVRRMIATITQIESVVTPSGNSGHVVVPKAWIGKEAIVVLKETQSKGKGKK
jgi:putative transposon-encoded protein